MTSASQPRRRAAIYARSACDRNGDSVAHQLEWYLAAAITNGLKVVVAHVDEAVAGDSDINTPGSRCLFADVQDGLFDILLIDGPERLSRSSDGLSAAIKHLQNLGIEV